MPEGYVRARGACGGKRFGGQQKAPLGAGLVVFLSDYSPISLAILSEANLSRLCSMVLRISAIVI